MRKCVRVPAEAPVCVTGCVIVGMRVYVSPCVCPCLHIAHVGMLHCSDWAAAAVRA